MENLNKDDKWVLVSCLQKSIRRGFDDLAGIYAKKLCEIGERSYLAYRLSIVAVEDIGIAAIDDVTPFLSTRIKKAEVDKNGGEDYLVDTAKLFAKSKKDRTACDLVSMAQIYQPLNLSIEEHKKIFLDSTQHEINRTLSAWYILGAKKHKHNLIQSEVDNLDEFLKINEELLKKSPMKDKILGLLADSYPVHREPHFLVIGLLQSIYENEFGQEIKGFKTGDFFSRKFTPDLVENYFLMAGVDIHTAPGKTAAYNFLKRPSLMSEWLNHNEVPYDSRFSVIKILNFRAVGQMVDERLFYPTAVRIMREIQKESLNGHVGHTVDFKDAMKCFEASLPIWEQCVNEIMYRQYGKPNPQKFPFS